MVAGIGINFYISKSILSSKYFIISGICDDWDLYILHSFTFILYLLCNWLWRQTQFAMYKVLSISIILSNRGIALLNWLHWTDDRQAGKGNKLSFWFNYLTTTSPTSLLLLHDVPVQVHPNERERKYSTSLNVFVITILLVAGM